MVLLPCRFIAYRTTSPCRLQGNNYFSTFVPSQDEMRKKNLKFAEQSKTTLSILSIWKNKKLTNCLFVYKTSMHERWDSRYKFRKEKNKKFNKLG